MVALCVWVHINLASTNLDTMLVICRSSRRDVLMNQPLVSLLNRPTSGLAGRSGAPQVTCVYCNSFRASAEKVFVRGLMKGLTGMFSACAVCVSVLIGRAAAVFWVHKGIRSGRPMLGAMLSLVVWYIRGDALQRIRLISLMRFIVLSCYNVIFMYYCATTAFQECNFNHRMVFLMINILKQTKSDMPRCGILRVGFNSQ